MIHNPDGMNPANPYSLPGQWRHLDNKSKCLYMQKWLMHNPTSTKEDFFDAMGHFYNWRVPRPFGACYACEYALKKHTLFKELRAREGVTTNTDLFFDLCSFCPVTWPSSKKWCMQCADHNSPYSVWARNVNGHSHGEYIRAAYAAALVYNLINDTWED